MTWKLWILELLSESIQTELCEFCLQQLSSALQRSSCLLLFHLLLISGPLEFWHMFCQLIHWPLNSYNNSSCSCITVEAFISLTQLFYFMQLLQVILQKGQQNQNENLLLSYQNDLCFSNFYIFSEFRLIKINLWRCRCSFIDLSIYTVWYFYCF